MHCSVINDYNIVGVNSFTIYDVRLGNGSATYQGRVEFLTYRGWLPLCDDYYYWYYSESRVICRQFGYDYVSHSEK